MYVGGGPVWVHANMGRTTVVAFMNKWIVIIAFINFPQLLPDFVRTVCAGDLWYQHYPPWEEEAHQESTDGTGLSSCQDLYEWHPDLQTWHAMSWTWWKLQVPHFERCSSTIDTMHEFLHDQDRTVGTCFRYILYIGEHCHESLNNLVACTFARVRSQGSWIHHYRHGCLPARFTVSHCIRTHGYSLNLNTYTNTCQLNELHPGNESISQSCSTYSSGQVHVGNRYR